MSKGSKRRPAQVSREEIERRWRRARWSRIPDGGRDAYVADMSNEVPPK